MPTKPMTAIVVTFQSERMLGNALASIRRCHDENLLDMVIVDNGSTDGTRKVVERTTPCTIMVNPDAVIESDALRTMLDFLEMNPAVGIVGPAILEGEGSSTELQHAGPQPTPWAIVRKEMPYLDRQSTIWPIVPGSAPVRRGWVCGAVLMMPTELMRKLNGFDPRFFLYWEETDLCKRAEEALSRHGQWVRHWPGMFRAPVHRRMIE